jgi:plastocyanin
MSRTRATVVLLGALTAALAWAPSAGAAERLLTLYSPQLTSQPYVHKSHQVDLKPDGRQAPAEPGFVTGIAEQVLVDSKDPDAKPLPVAKMMVHHFLYFAPGRVNDSVPGTCFNGLGFITGRGEEHPSGKFGQLFPSVFRDRYGIENRTADGSAPGWRLTAMVMNHYQRVKKFYVRTKVWYTTDQRTPLYPVTVGDCSTLPNGMSYDVPGGGRPGSLFKNTSRWTVPAGFNARIFGAHSHQHGGAENHTLRSVSCNRRIYDADTYYGPANHPYNTIRPILHEPGPIANGTFGTLTGVPIREGEVLERTAYHDNANLHVASMGFWTLYAARDSDATKCAPMPQDVVELDKPARYDRTPNHGLVVPQLAKPSGSFRPLAARAPLAGDGFFRPGKLSVRRGQSVTWRFTGLEPHSVTVANGPRGFSSVYWGQGKGTSYSFKPTVRGTYRLTCLVHPTTMGQTVVVR